MKAIKEYLKKIREQFGTRSSKAGSYSFFLTAIVLAIIITVNFALSFLPDSYVQEDLTANQLYSISSQSKVLLSTLEEDITIYWVVASGEEDEYIEKLLHNYEDYTSKVSVVKKDPDLDPEFTNSYTDGEVYNNSVIVECGDKYRYISYEEMYEVSNEYYSIYSTADEFSGESLITSAISYCITEELPVIHVLEGHGEEELTEDFQNALERDNLETEKDMLIEYLDNGGRLLIISGTVQEDELTNLNAVAEYYGISVLEGVVVEEDTGYYVFESPVMLMPEMNSSDITDPLIEDNYHVIVPVSKALDLSEVSDDVTVTSLLESSESSFIKEEGYDITTYEKEDGDIEGPLSLAVLVTKDLEDDRQSQFVWIASSEILNEVYNSYSSDANEDFVLNALEMMCEKDDSISVRSKSLTNEYLTISTSDSSLIKVVTIAVIPAAYLVIGIIVVVRRRRR